jgi:competence protein ComGC
MKKKKLIILIICLLIVILFGVLFYLFKPNIKIPTKKTTTTTTTKVLKIVNPESKSRPYAIMINNLGTARPLQSGLQDAYIIYEIIVEGGLTRYMALFMDQSTARIGSIRSARHYFLDYALENDTIYVHHGQSPQAQADFSNLGVDHIVVGDSTGWRDKDLSKQGYAYEHTLFTSIEKLKNGIGSKRTERKKDLLLNYSIDDIDLSKIENSKVANNVSITYSNNVTTSYVYDSTNKVYNRFVNDKEHKDYVTGKQYNFKNIITYQVKNYTLDDAENKGRQGIDNIGSGTGYYITEGYAVPITWEKSSRSSQTIYKYENGNEIDVNDGNTFIQIQPKGEALNIS